MSNNTIGERLKAERKRLGLNQTDFAKIANLTKKSLFNYETGERSPDAEALLKWAGSGLDVHFIIHGSGKIRDEEKQELSVDECVLLELYRKLDFDEKRKFVMDLASTSKAHEQ